MAQLLEYNSNVDSWLAADNYWGVLSHLWTYQEVWDMLEQRAQLGTGHLWLAYFVWKQKSSFHFLRFDNDHFYDDEYRSPDGYSLDASHKWMSEI